MMFSKCENYYMVEIGKRKGAAYDWVCIASDLPPPSERRIVGLAREKLGRHAVSAVFVGVGHEGLEKARRFMREHNARFHTIHKMLT